jgi:hypothetical protein
MRRLWAGLSIITLTGVLAPAGSLRAGTPPQGESEVTKKLLLLELHVHYVLNEILDKKPPKKVEDSGLGKSAVKAIKRWFALEKLGQSVVNFKEEDGAKIVMVYGIDAPRNGGLVLFYNGDVKRLSAVELKKRLGKDKQRE